MCPKRPGSKVHSTVHHWSCRVPFYGRADNRGGWKGRWDGRGLGLQSARSVCYRNEKGKQIIRLPLRPTWPLKTGRQDGTVPTLGAVGNHPAVAAKRFSDPACQSADGMAAVRARSDPTTSAPFAPLLANCKAVVTANKRSRQVETIRGQSDATPR